MGGLNTRFCTDARVGASSEPWAKSVQATFPPSAVLQAQGAATLLGLPPPPRPHPSPAWMTSPPATPCLPDLSESRPDLNVTQDDPHVGTSAQAGLSDPREAREHFNLTSSPLYSRPKDRKNCC